MAVSFVHRTETSSRGINRAKIRPQPLAWDHDPQRSQGALCALTCVTQMLPSDLHRRPTQARGSPYLLLLLSTLTIVTFFESDHNNTRTKTLKTREVK